MNSLAETCFDVVDAELYFGLGPLVRKTVGASGQAIAVEDQGQETNDSESSHWAKRIAVPMTDERYSSRHKAIEEFGSDAGVVHCAACVVIAHIDEDSGRH